MNRFIKIMLVGALILQGLGCASKGTEEDLSLEDSSFGDGMASEGDFSDEGAESLDSGEASESAATDDELSLDDEVAASDQEQAPAAEQSAATNSEDPFADEQPAQESLAQQEPPPPVMEDLTPAPVEEPAPVETAEVLPPAPMTEEISSVEPTVQEPAPMVAMPAEITGLKFKANESGGTIVIESTQPVSFTTRSNPALKQFIVEVQNAVLPSKLKRSLNTKDIRGSIGAVDAYQNSGSSTARFVIQLRDGVTEPAVEQEGNALLIVASSPQLNEAPLPEVAANGFSANEVTSEEAEGDILSSYSLTEFLAGNVKFYGKKISIEMNKMDVRDALRFITEESGVNMIISDEVKGDVSLKLRQVPWDQALVVLLKTKNLGYVRQGSVLRITTMDELIKEEDRVTKLVADQKKTEALKVRMFPISYAKVDELEKKMKDFLTERGRAVGDARTNALVVTDTEESLIKVAKLIESLDVQPPQVLIEGKIVEAKESFQRDVGVEWAASGQTIKLGQSRRGPINMSPAINVNQGAVGAGNLGINLNIGTFDIFGQLSAALSLREKEDVVKVLSSPRILSLTNETSMITQTSEVPVRTTTITNGTPQVSYQFKPLTLKLEVTPQITADASIIMKLGISRQFKGAIVDAREGTFEVNSREASTRVLVKNGHTAVIGGIYTNESTDGNSGVPGLRNLPFVGGLFSTKAITKDKSEMLIFLTPRIVGQADAGGKNSNANF